ncbi:hypothetical protein HPB52_008002 [Rhipicephalus sanguineus]|uniref:Uncharacterized protein n=1 Tax=Rhipicephalus sanguineus TaxID=34632 RepID=A0A9D4PQM7_RHISA|nr:hypothetical protein HPB52_008002 [Rhipicephalus sanguineus]
MSNTLLSVDAQGVDPSSRRESDDERKRPAPRGFLAPATRHCPSISWDGRCCDAASPSCSRRFAGVVSVVSMSTMASIPAHKVSKPARTLLRPKSLGLKAQKRRNPHSEDAPGVRSRLRLTKHPRRPNTGARATPATGDPNAPVPMMPTAFDMDTAPPLCVTDAIQPLSSQIPVLSQTPAATPFESEAQTSTQQVSQRSSLPKCGNARPPPQRLAKCTTIVVKFQGYVDITRLNFSAVCQGILYAVQATATEKEDTYIKRRDVQNLIVVQTFRATIAHRFLQCTNIIVSGTTYPIRCYNAFDNTYSRGVIHGIYPDITEDALRSELTIQGRTIANVRRLGTTNTVLVIVEGEELPRHARLFSGVYNIYPERRKAAQCSSCQELGHRADVCRNRRTFVRCPHCSKTLPPEQEASEQSHECEQYCFLCDQHDHSPTSPNCSTKAVNMPRRNPAAEDSANTPQYSQPSAAAEAWPSLPSPALHTSNRFAPLQDTSPPRSLNACSLKLLQATTENHSMPQAQRGDPQEDIKDPRNRLRGQAPHHHIMSSGGTNTTANLQLTRQPYGPSSRTNSLQTYWLSSLLMDIIIPVTLLPWATPGPTLRPQHPGVPIPPRVGLTSICRQWTAQNAIRNEGPA